MATNRDKASGQRDEFSQRAHATHLKVEEELSKNHHTDDSKQTQAASKGVMKREKAQNADPHQEEGEVKAKVDQEGNNNTAEASSQQPAEEEDSHPIQAEKQRDLALRKAAAVFEDVHKKTIKADPHRRASAANKSDEPVEEKGGEESKLQGSEGDSLKDKASNAASDAKETVKDAASDAKEKVQETASTVKAKVQEKATDVKETVQEGASTAKAKVEEGAAHAKTRVQEGAAAVQERVQNGAADLQAKVHETAEKTSNAVVQFKDEAVHKMEEVKDSAVALKNSAVQKAVEAKDAVAAQLSSAKETLANTPAEIRHKAGELQEEASYRSKKAQEAFDANTGAARERLEAMSQKVKDEAMQLQHAVVDNASYVATQAQKAGAGLLSFVNTETQAAKETVEHWGEAAKERVDHTRDYVGGKVEEARKEEGDHSHEPSLTEKASDLWNRTVSSSDHPTSSHTVEVETPRSRDSLPSPSALDSSTSEAVPDVVDLSTSAVPEFSGRVPSLGNYDGIKGEDEGMGDGARLAAMVQDMSEL